jgi:ATP-dependent Lhr-like helicase
MTSTALAAPLQLEVAEIEAVLLRLEAEGSVMRGHFIPGASQGVEIEWCERRLLARIHRYTVNRLRQEIEPVAARDFMRFLFEWQRVAPSARVEGADAVAGIVSQLEGFEAPAAAWETEILPSRINEYDPMWLDEQSRAGRVVWTRIAALQASGSRAPSPVRTTPITLASRRNLPMWAALAQDGGQVALSSNARRVMEFIGSHGASFFDEITDGAKLLGAQVEDGLGELVAQGLVNADSFAGLRALLVPSERRRASDGRKRPRRTALFGIEDAGRWALVRRRPLREGASVSSSGSASLPVSSSASDPSSDSTKDRPIDRSPDDIAQTVEHVTRSLLKRYGVVFWHLVAREANWLPPWRNLLRCLRRLEARGEIRGGRFVAGLSGEQFALPEAVGLLREVRKREGDHAWISLSGADPLNLVGVLSPGSKLPALTGNRVLYRDGLPIAVLAGGEMRFLEQLEPADEWAARNALQRRQVPSALSMLS